MRIQGFQKTTLLDYPGHLACTIFLANCNFRCPFCHNASLALQSSSIPEYTEEEIFETLKKRKTILEGVCITGGEPTLSKDLICFIQRIKELGLDVKLDTNGTNPSTLSYLIEHKLIDYVAMDVKNSKEKYGLTTGIQNINIDTVSESIQILLSNQIPYEFRTTIVAEYHTVSDIKSIGEWIFGAENYFLQSFKSSEHVLKPGLHAPSKSLLKDMLKAAKPYVKNISIRGIDL